MPGGNGEDPVGLVAEELERREACAIDSFHMARMKDSIGLRNFSIKTSST